MTTNKKRPSDFTSWDGNLDSVIHTHRPGNSQKASIRQIVDAAVAAVPMSEAGGMSPGDVVLKPVGAYEDFFVANGDIKLDSEAPALAAAIGNPDSYYSYSADSVRKYNFPESALGTGYYGQSFCTSGDYGILTAATNLAQIFNVKTNTLVGTISFSSQDLTSCTRNALYGMSTTYDVYMCGGIRTASLVFNATKLTTMNGEFRCLASIGDDLDLIVGSTQSYFKVINTVTRVTTAIVPTGTVSITCATQSGTDKIFALATINGKTGFFELIYDSAINNFRYKLLLDLAIVGGFMSSSQGSSTVYFGRNGLEYCYDINTTKITPVVMPNNILLTANSRLYSRDNFVGVINSVYTADANYVSFDRGLTWVLAPQVGYLTMDMKLNTAGTELVMLTRNPSYAAQGVMQSNSLMKLAANQFKLPNLISGQEGYKYYVKK